jgi:uncharacterized protein YprB with RNaseH-like and TPR domain
LSALADRIRGIVAPGTPGPKGPGLPDRPAPPAFPDLVTALGGIWCGGCFVVERRWDPAARHGCEAVGTLAERLEEASGDAVLYTSGTPARAPFVFFDLETTGLSGGAGTQAFLVGCARFEADGSFVTRQFLLTQYADERPLLETVSAELARAGTLVSFNGKSFDAPLLETRYLFHRMDWIGGRLPHMDVLHPARRFWKRGNGHTARAAGARAFPPSRNASADRRSLGGGGQARRDGDPERVALHKDGGCSLGALERQVVGARRVGDVAGFEIPARYFQFIRTGDARPLVAVLEHNRLDLLTLAALTARLLHLTRTGPDAARHAREALALGHVYARAGLCTRACDAFRHAVDMTDRPAAHGSMALLKFDSLRSLAVALRRARLHGDAAVCWRRLLDVPGCPAPIAREAAEALAIHHEHRMRDLAAAKALALRGLENGLHSAWTQAVQHRLARIERKMAAVERRLNLE